MMQLSWELGIVQVVGRNLARIALCALVIFCWHQGCPAPAETGFFPVSEIQILLKETIHIIYRRRAMVVGIASFSFFAVRRHCYYDDEEEQW
jgi:hypothetical protein